MSLQINTPYAPIEKINWVGLAEREIELYIKREDLSHPFISGNKWRKLKFHLLHAETQEKNLLVTFGGAYSNHLLATAAAGSKYGFQTFGFVRGEKVENLVLKMCAVFGMQLAFVSRENYQQKDALFASHFGSNPHALFIPEGGAGDLGELGVAELLAEKYFQENFTDIVCSVGTGSTLRGLLMGIQTQQLNCKAHGIVVLKGAEKMEEMFQDYPANAYTLHHQFHGGGYAKANKDLIAFIHYFASQTGILLDQVYEGKMMLAILSLIEQDYFKPKSKILAFHNGGIIGLTGIL